MPEIWKYLSYSTERVNIIALDTRRLRADLLEVLRNVSVLKSIRILVPQQPTLISKYK